MDATLKTWLLSPATGLASYVVKERVSIAPTAAAQGTGLPSTVMSPATHAPKGSVLVADFDVRSIDLPGPGPRGAPV